MLWCEYGQEACSCSNEDEDENENELQRIGIGLGIGLGKVVTLARLAAGLAGTLGARLTPRREIRWKVPKTEKLDDHD